MNQGGIQRSSLIFKNCLVKTFRVQATFFLLAHALEQTLQKPYCVRQKQKCEQCWSTTNAQVKCTSKVALPPSMWRQCPGYHSLPLSLSLHL